MSKIRSKGNKDTELKLAEIFRRHRIIGWRRHQNILGRPDFVFRSQRVIVFVDGCFWHGCPKHGRKPDSNRGYWLPKLERNKRRDREISKRLRIAGWKVVRLWEHRLSDPEAIAAKIKVVLERNRRSRQRKKSKIATPDNDGLLRGWDLCRRRASHWGLELSGQTCFSHSSLSGRIHRRSS